MGPTGSANRGAPPTGDGAAGGPPSPADVLAQLRARVAHEWEDRAARPGIGPLRGPVVACLVGAVLLVAVGGVVLGVARSDAPAPGSAAPPVVATTLPFAPTSTTTAAPAEVVVHIAGAVTHPGLYRLPPTARVGDLVAAAGGTAPDADPDRVNLASPVADGTRVFVPRRGEPAPGIVADPGAGPLPPGGGPSAPAVVVDLNAAGATQLDELPGVGPATAQAIVEHRDRHGPFRTVDGLLDVAGIGPARLDKLRARVKV